MAAAVTQPPANGRRTDAPAGGLTSFGFRPSSHKAIRIDLNLYDIRAATNRTVFDERLFVPLGRIDGNDNLLSARIANIRDLLGHFADAPATFLSHAR